MTSEKRVCLGAFAGAHGVRGEAKIKSFTAAPEDVAAYGPVTTEDGRRFSLTVIREMKPGVVLARAPEIASREDAAALAGTLFYVDRARLPETEEDEFYLDDLVGLSVFTAEGAPAGRVAAVHNFGAGDILELEGVPDRKKSILIPFTKKSVPEIDLEGGRLTVDAAFLEEGEAQPEDEEQA